MNTNVIAAIDSERKYQEQKWPNHLHTIGEFILIMEKCLNDAKRAWVYGTDQSLHEIRQVTAVGVAAMEQHAAPMRTPLHLAPHAPITKESHEI